MSHKAQPPVFAPIKTPPPAYKGPAPVNVKPAPPLAVTFRETGGGPSMEEQCTIEHIKSFLGSSDFDEDLCLKAIRHPRMRSQRTNNEEEYLQEVVGVYMDELNQATEKEQIRSQTPRPAQGCANRPMQTIEEAAAEIARQGSTMAVVPVSCAGPTATTATPLPGLPSAAEREQSDIEKAIAESLITQGAPGNRSYVSTLPANPEDMLRKEGVSVGLHNTGNTCWFNVVAQLLFHLPRYRRVVYEYLPKESSDKDSSKNSEITEADLVEKMRYLFASMDLGNRRYIDPSEALNVVSVLASRSRSDIILGRQQDASEMMSNLMEWMEKGLVSRSDVEPAQPPSMTKPSSPKSAVPRADAMETSPVASVETNSVIDATPVEPVTDKPNHDASEMSRHQSVLGCIKALFHGYQVERATNGLSNMWNKLEYTSLFPVHVSHGNLHDALEAHQFLNESGKEPWFETLPAVLIFSLGRYFFNGTKGETEKLNMRFHFPRTIYMDRYMASVMSTNSDVQTVEHLIRTSLYRINYETISKIRHVRNNLRSELADVRAVLKGLNEFQIADHSEKLVNILRATLSFVSGGSVMNSCSNEKMDVSVPAMTFPGPVTVNKHQSFVEDKLAVFPSTTDSEQFSSFVPLLQNAIDELEEKQKQLCSREKELARLIDDIYERDDLKVHGYRLHAVAIHQGQANAGHYWAYVRRGNDDSQWEKFNDQRVENAVWSDIEAEAVGGSRTTSAYFLLYVSSSAEPWLFSNDRPPSSFLKDEVREQVEMENSALELEVERFRCTHNEDDRKNAEIYELPFEECDLERCPAPPPMGNVDEFLCGTPAERALLDPESLAVSLQNFCDQWYSDPEYEQEKRKLLSLLEFNKGTYPPSQSPDGVIDAQAKLFYRNVLKGMLITAMRKSQAAGVHMETKDLYNKIIREFYDEADNVVSNDRTRPLRSMPDMWYTLGFRVPAKIVRFAIVRALLNASESEGLAQCARDEIDEFTSVPYVDHYLVPFQRISHFYDLVKTLWNVVHQVASEMNHTNAAKHPRLSPKAVELNIKMLKMVRSVTNIYDRVYLEIGSFQGPGYQQHLDYIIPSFIIRGFNILSVQCIFAAIVQFLVEREPPHNDVIRLLSESLTTVEVAVQTLTILAGSGYRDAAKIVNHINDTLGMISLVFSNLITVPLKRELSRRLNDATQSNQKFNEPAQRYISQATDICQEIEQAHCQLSLLGLGDPTEAENVYIRLMGVVSDIINNAMQAEDKQAKSPTIGMAL